jgi:hypothetical protein
VGPYRQSTGFSALDENAKRLARRHEGVQRPAWAQMRWFWHDGTPAELPTEEYLSGFLQLADVLAWFSPSDLAELDELGFVLKEYEVSALDVLAAPADDERLAQAAFLVDMTRVLRVHRPLDALL